MRIIAFNRRGYVGSTPYASEELESLKTKNVAVDSKFLRDRGLEIAKLLIWTVQELQIPSVSVKGGGITLMGWSIGNITTMAMLRSLPTFPEGVRNVVVKYLRNFIVYGVSFLPHTIPH